MLTLSKRMGEMVPMLYIVYGFDMRKEIDEKIEQNGLQDDNTEISTIDI